MIADLPALRRALCQRLRDEHAEDLIGPMQHCGSPVHLTCTCCGAERIAKMHCKRRYCPECQPMVAAKRVARWQAAITGLQWPLFITLTMPNTPDPDSIKTLKKAWARLRRRKLIATKIKGGVATFEVTNKGRGWHPHIHAVADCRWLSLHIPEPRRTDTAAVIANKCALAQRELSQLWAEVLGEPEAIVWVQRVKTVNTMAKEVLKYAVKGSDLVASRDPIAPLLRVLKTTRLLSGWGSLHPMPSPDTEDAPAVVCDKCNATKSYVPAEVVTYLARSGQTQLGSRDQSYLYQK